MRVIEGVSHVTVAAHDLDEAAKDYALLLATKPTHGPQGLVFATGNVSLVLRTAAPNETEGLCDLAFRTPDLEKARAGFARCGLPSMDTNAASESAFEPSGTHGLPLALTRGTTANAQSSHLSLDHVVIRTPNPERAIALYGGRLGLDMRLDRSNSAWNARLMFFRCGDTVVEIAHVLSNGVSDAPDTFGGLSWRVPDIEAEHARLSGDGFAMSEVRTGRRPGSRVCTVRTRTTGVPTILLGVTS